MESEDPPPKVYGFKEREFKRDNSLSSDQKPMPTAKELAMMAGQVTRQTAANPGAKAEDPNDVYKILEHNRAMEQTAGLDQVEIRKVKSRRARDYWLLLISSEALLGVITVQGRDNPVQFVFGLAGMVLVAISLTWIMWQLMSRY
jgi:hypothetical protein